MDVLIGMGIGAAFVGIVWRVNEVRWNWKITQDVHEHDDPDDLLLIRYRKTRRH